MPRDLAYFVSYARTDHAQVERLSSLLTPRLTIVRDFRFTGWIDDEIRVGERWTDAIGAALAGCDFGLMLLSPAFFASGFIRREELPHFIDQSAAPTATSGATGQTRIRKPLVPVMLKPVPLDCSADLAGLEQLQVFRDREGRAFSQTRGTTADAFTDALVAAILAKLRVLCP
jgi:hypothetical protein